MTNILNLVWNDEFKKALEENAWKLVILDFWAPWCGPCRALAPTLENLSFDFAEKIQIIKMNVDETENQALTQQFSVSSIPAIFLIKDSKVVKNFAWALQYDQFKQVIEENL